LLVADAPISHHLDQTLKGKFLYMSIHICIAIHSFIVFLLTVDEPLEMVEVTQVTSASCEEGIINFVK